MGDAVAEHYSGSGAIVDAVAAALRAAGRDPAQVSTADLAGVDEFHIRGREATREIAEALAVDTADNFGRSGSLADVLDGADVFIGVSGGTVDEEYVARMAPDAIIFGLANPNPEVHPTVAHKYARIVATGRSDFPNQINNVLAFPGIFRGAFDARSTAITEGMKLAAAQALSAIVADEARDDLIIPSPFDPRVGPTVAAAVAEAARRDGVARR